MLPLSLSSWEAVDLADWLEVNVLVGAGGQASLDDLRTALKAGSLGDSYGLTTEGRTMELEGIVGNVREELSQRSSCAGHAYPFSLRGGSIERKRRGVDVHSSTYAFCLLLSLLPWDQRKIPGHFPERTFEEVACMVAERYINGKSVRFGWPRVPSTMPSRFEGAVDELCRRLGEGGQFNGTEATGAEKDAGLDVVAWRPLDKRTGKLVLFGACATGQDWNDKLDELQPGAFCGSYFTSSILPRPTKAFFTPRIVPSHVWRVSCRKAGIIFDRCRVSRFVPMLPSMRLHGDTTEWMEGMIERAAKKYMG